MKTASCGSIRIRYFSKKRPTGVDAAGRAPPGLPFREVRDGDCARRLSAAAQGWMPIQALQSTLYRRHPCASRCINDLAGAAFPADAALRRALMKLFSADRRRRTSRNDVRQYPVADPFLTVPAAVRGTLREHSMRGASRYDGFLSNSASVNPGRQGASGTNSPRCTRLMRTRKYIASSAGTSTTFVGRPGASSVVFWLFFSLFLQATCGSGGPSPRARLRFESRRTRSGGSRGRSQPGFPDAAPARRRRCEGASR